MTDGLILIGGGGHCKACIDVIESAGIRIAGILDREGGANLMGIPVLGSDEKLEELLHKQYEFLVTVGMISSPEPRVRIFEKISELGGKLASVVSAHALLGRNSSIGKGTIVMHQALVNSDARVGENCIINNKALVEHDARIGHHTHISTAAIVNGGCTIGNRVFIGSNSVLAQGIRIADDVVIGAGSIVIKDIETAGVYAGNPVRKLK